MIYLYKGNPKIRFIKLLNNLIFSTHDSCVENFTFLNQIKNPLKC
jgi:hypothetical protein